MPSKKLKRAHSLLLAAPRMNWQSSMRYFICSRAFLLGFSLAIIAIPVPARGGNSSQQQSQRDARDDQEAKQALTAQAEKQALQARARGDRQAALGILLDALKADPQAARLLLDVGSLELEMGLNVDALKTFQLGHDLKADDLQLLYGLGRAELAVQDMPAAERHMREYLAKRDDDATAHFGLGRVMQMLERTEEAKREFERSIELQPRQTESYYELGDIALNEANYDRAADLFRKVLAGDPKHGGALTGLGIVAFRQKKYEEADGYLQSAIKSAPGYQPAHYYCGLNLKRLGKDAESERELQIALKLGEQAETKQKRTPRVMPKPGDSLPSEVE